MGFELAIRAVRPGLTRPINQIRKTGSWSGLNCISVIAFKAQPISTRTSVISMPGADSNNWAYRVGSSRLDAFRGNHISNSIRTFSGAGSGPVDVIIEDFELTSPVSPDRWFKGYILDSDNLLPKVLPIFKSIESTGDGGVGSVKTLIFSVGEHDHFSKHRTDELDETNRVFKFTVVGGGDLGDEFEIIENIIKIEPGPDGGSVYKCSTIWHTKSDDHNKMQETIKRATAGSKAFFQAVDAYLQAHPQEYI